MEITILKTGPRRGSGRGLDARLLRSQAERALRLLEVPPRAQLSVILDSDESVRRLHRRYFGKNSRTNVISFGQWEGDPARIRRSLSRIKGRRPVPLGDIVISVDRAAAEAETGGISVGVRMIQLLLHGLLHLLGHEHERGGALSRRMQREERRLLRALGVRA